MKKSNLFCLLLLVFITTPIFAGSVKDKANNKPMYISVDEIGAKLKPSFWARAKDRFYYGDKVFIIEEKGSWIRIEDDEGRNGWVKDTVITSRKLVGKKVSLTTGELALAGKGFSSPVEAEYSSTYDINFDLVDYVENIQLPDSEYEKFIKQGNLNGGEE